LKVLNTSIAILSCTREIKEDIIDEAERYGWTDFRCLYEGGDEMTLSAPAVETQICGLNVEDFMHIKYWTGD